MKYYGITLKRMRNDLLCSSQFVPNSSNLPICFVERNNLPENVTLERLPEDASEKIRLVRIGNYDVCPCIGKHVRSTKQRGKFELFVPICT